MLKKIITTLMVMVLCLSVTPIQAEASTKIKTTKDLEKYLQKNYGTLKTKYKTFDLSDDIMVVENEDEYNCFDIAIVVDWKAVGDSYYKVQDSIKYTDKQKKALDKVFKNYQKKIAAVAMKAFPDKKIRGGFVDYGYEYANIKEDYYEFTLFGWTNYDYTSNDLFVGYDDTEVSDFHWVDFYGLDHPSDTIGLY